MENLLSANQQSEAVFVSHAIVSNRIISLSPSSDLLAIADQHDSVNVFRFNGQFAFGKKRPSPSTTLQNICWKHDGKCLGIAWSSGTIEILSSETGKILLNPSMQNMWITDWVDPNKAHQAKNLPSLSDSKAATCLGWSFNFIRPADVRRLGMGTQVLSSDDSTTKPRPYESDNEPTHLALDDLLDGRPDLQRPTLPLDLPYRLATLDVERVLPKLGVPPPVGPGPVRGLRGPRNGLREAFSSQASLDAVFHSSRIGDMNAVSTLISCSADGKIEPVLYDTVNIGPITILDSTTGSNYRTVLVNSHPFSCTLMLLVKSLGYDHQDQAQGMVESTSLSDSVTYFALAPLTLRAIRNHGSVLQLIAFKLTQLQNVSYYIEDVGEIARQLFLETRRFPENRLELLDDQLKGEGHGTSMEALYQLAATGYCREALKNWLVDTVADRGQRRWESEVDSAFSKFIDALHENLLPAIDRCSILASGLRGLAKYHDTSERLNLSPSSLTGILDVLQSMRLIVHESLNIATEDRRQFLAFSKWLRFQIELHTSENSADSDESIEQQATFDFGQILSYIQGEFVNPRLIFYWDEASQDCESETSETVSVDLTQAATAATIEKFRAERNSHEKKRRLFGALEPRLHQGIRSILIGLGGWQRQMALTPGSIILEKYESTCFDMRMVFEVHDASEQLTTYVAIVPEIYPHNVRIHQVLHSDALLDMGESITRQVAWNIRFPVGEIRHLKFLDDEYLVLIFRGEDISYLLSIPYAKITSKNFFGGEHNHFTPSTPTGGEATPPVLVSAHERKTDVRLGPQKLSSIEAYTLQTFPHSERFRPDTLAVNGRKDKRVICVLGEDKRRYRIFSVEGKQTTNSETTLPLGDDVDVSMEDKD